MRRENRSSATWSGEAVTLPFEPPIAKRGSKGAIRVIRDIVQGAWRRRVLITLPILVMLPISLAAAFMLPKAYTARSLMQLQEASRENPFSRDTDASSTYRVQERFAGIRSLFMSDRVLARALGQDAQSLSPAERETKIADLRQAVTLDLIGGDFIEVKLSGAKAEGLGNMLETVMASFLEALVPEQGGATAAQLIVNARRSELDALIKTRDDVQRELAGVQPKGPDEDMRNLADIEARRQEAQGERAHVDADIARLRSALGNPSEKSLDRAIAALSGTGGSEAEQRSSSDLSLDNPDTVRNLTVLGPILARRQEISTTVQMLDAESAKFKGRLTHAQALRDRLSTLQKEIALAAEQYDQLQRRFASATTAKGTGILKAPEMIRIIDPPRDPVAASRSRLPYLLSGLIAGALIGVALAFMAEWLDQRIRHEDEAADVTGLPVLAVVRD